MTPEAGTTRTEGIQAEAVETAGAAEEQMQGAASVSGNTTEPEARPARTAGRPAAGETGVQENRSGIRPAAKPEEAVEVGAVLEGKVTSITKFGAFVSLENHRSGLVHISEIANTYVNDVHDYLEEGQTVKVLVLSAENGKINLSIKKAAATARGTAASGGARPPAKQGGGQGSAPQPPRSLSRAQRQTTLPPSGDQAFEDKLKRFLSSSEGKMADLNRNRDSKRGGGKRRR